MVLSHCIIRTVQQQKRAVTKVSRDPTHSLAWLAKTDVQVVSSGQDAGMALAVVLLQTDAVLVFEDCRQHKPVVLDELAEVVLLVHAVIT